MMGKINHHCLQINPPSFMVNDPDNNGLFDEQDLCTNTIINRRRRHTHKQIEGPYFVACMTNRSDARSYPSDDSIQQGIPLQFVIHVYRINNNVNNTNKSTATDASSANAFAVSCMPVRHIFAVADADAAKALPFIYIQKMFF